MREPATDNPRDAFLSYSREDSDLALWLHGQLEARGLSVFVDQLDITPGQNADHVLARSIRSCTYFVPLVTVNFVKSDWTDWEISTALMCQPVGKVVPILAGIAPADMPATLAAFVPLQLSREPETDREVVDVLAAALRGEDVPALRRRQRKLPAPSFPDAKAGDHAARLKALYAQRAELEAEGEAASEIQREIRTLKHQMRERAGPIPQAGYRFGDGRFQLVEWIGTGGFASVWKAYDEHDHRIVAVKVLHAHLAVDRSRVARFERGAAQAARLRHPGIVRIVAGPTEEDGYHWFAMDYLPGGDLQSAVLEGRIAGVGGLRSLLPVADALQFAHGRNLVHRDVKPQNILIDSAGGTQLTDFDLVWALDSIGGTLTGEALGTLGFAAPESLRDASDVGPSADVYSLGMTALFVLNRGEVLDGVFRHPQQRLDELYCPPSIKRVIARAIEIDSTLRWATAEDFASGLETAIAANEPPERSEPTPRPVHVVARELGVRFASVHILEDVSIAILRGELVAVLGLSGGGKSVLLRCLAGVVTPSSGSVTIDGNPPRSSRVGFVEDGALPADLRLGELMRFHAELFASRLATRDAVGEHVDEKLRTVGLPDVGNYLPTEISTGMKRRLLVAMELLREPEVLLLDDPLAALDLLSANAILQLCRELQQRGTTVVMTLGSVNDRDFHLFDRVIAVSRQAKGVAWSGPPADAIEFFSDRPVADSRPAATACDFLVEAAWGADSFAGVERTRHVDEPLASARAAWPSVQPSPPPSSWRQLGPLVRRYALQIRRRRGLLGRYLAEAVLVGGIAVFLSRAPSPSSAGIRVSLLALLAFWLGSSGAAAEVERESFVLRREGALGLSPGAYLISKLVVQSAITLVQLALALAVFSALAGSLVWNPRTGALLAATSIVAVAHGLLVSTLVTNRPSAGGSTNLLLAMTVAQAAFCGIVFRVEDGLGAWLGIPIVTRWVAAATMDPQNSATGHTLAFLAIVTLGVVCIALAARTLRRRIPG